jgi:predicted MFS family arabinose efflux permease
LIDLFSRQQRSRALSAFYLAMPFGSALGIVLGPYIAERTNWHMAFYIVGVPGLIAAFLAFLLPEPVRGASEGISVDRLKAHEKAGASREDYVDLMVNSSYTYSVFGMAAYTFGIGGMLVWVPNYLFNTRHFDQQHAAKMLGLCTFAAAIVGMTLGGWLTDRLAKTKPQALFLVSGLSMIASIPFVLAALFSTSGAIIYPMIFTAEALMFVNTGPCNAIVANVVQPNLRAAAFAISTFAIHFLGDIWSPWLIGKAADLFGDPQTMATPYGQLLKSIGAVPTQVTGHPPENIVAGLLMVVPALLLSGIVLIAGARHLPREMALMHAKLKASPRPSATNEAPAL